MRQDTEPWWRQAEADLASAELVFGGRVYYAASWFSHQAAEKAIKALYLERNWSDASRVHDLNLLGRHVGVPSDVSRDLAVLDPAFGLTRYPNALGHAPHRGRPEDPAMGQVRALTENDQAVRRFARRLRDSLGVERVLLFGDHLTGTATDESEYRLILIGARFDGQALPDRPVGLHEHFYAVGGDAPLDLICLTPDELERAKGRITLVSAVLPEAIDLLAEEPAPA